MNRQLIGDAFFTHTTYTGNGCKRFCCMLHSHTALSNIISLFNARLSSPSERSLFCCLLQQFLREGKLSKCNLQRSLLKKIQILQGYMGIPGSPFLGTRDEENFGLECKFPLGLESEVINILGRALYDQIMMLICFLFLLFHCTR